MITKQHIHDEIRNLRRELRLKQYEIARLIGINKATYANYESRSMPPADVYLKIMALKGREIRLTDIR
jgi:DNA-binding transcriptional regulator YiaG